MKFMNSSSFDDEDEDEDDDDHGGGACAADACLPLEFVERAVDRMLPSVCPTDSSEVHRSPDIHVSACGEPSSRNDHVETSSCVGADSSSGIHASPARLCLTYKNSGDSRDLMYETKESRRNLLRHVSSCTIGSGSSSQSSHGECLASSQCKLHGKRHRVRDRRKSLRQSISRQLTKTSQRFKGYITKKRTLIFAPCWLLLLNLILLALLIWSAIASIPSKNNLTCSVSYPSPKRLGLLVKDYVDTQTAVTTLNELWKNYKDDYFANEHITVGPWRCPIMRIQCYKYAYLADRASCVPTTEQKTVRITPHSDDPAWQGWEMVPKLSQLLNLSDNGIRNVSGWWRLWKPETENVHCDTLSSYYEYICDQLFVDDEANDDDHNYRDCYRQDIVTISHTSCQDLDIVMRYPALYLYYSVTNFFSTNRYYRSSVSMKQIGGNVIDAKDEELFNCSSYRFANDLKVTVENAKSVSFEVPPIQSSNGDNSILHPCGILPNTVFTDQYDAVMICDTTEDPVVERTYHQDEEDEQDIHLGAPAVEDFCTICCAELDACIQSEETRPSCCRVNLNMDLSQCIVRSTNQSKWKTIDAVDTLTIDQSASVLLDNPEVIGTNVRNPSHADILERRSVEWIPEYIFRGRVENPMFVNWLIRGKPRSYFNPYAKITKHKKSNIKEKVGTVQVRVKNRFACDIFEGEKFMIMASKYYDGVNLYQYHLSLILTILTAASTLYLAFRSFCEVFKYDNHRVWYQPIEENLSRLCEICETNGFSNMNMAITRRKCSHSGSSASLKDISVSDSSLEDAEGVDYSTGSFGGRGCATSSRPLPVEAVDDDSRDGDSDGQSSLQSADCWFVLNNEQFQRE
eukprot:GHVH01001879.1.p1 GENE.GHVH01001879.1~~GHVH01001879.1.p1  ORF type:complete len:857 (+),score=106.80 GHVH01001879.1:95-2665(+)